MQMYSATPLIANKSLDYILFETNHYSTVHCQVCKYFLWLGFFVCILQDKAGPHKDIYPYLIQELKPTLSELGISTPEELGIDKL